MLKVQEIREIIKLIDQSSIKEFTYETNGTKVAIKKSHENGVKEVEKQTNYETNKEEQKVETPKTVEKEVTKTKNVEEPTQSTTDQLDDYKTIQSPMVGTFYSAPNPESDPFVKVGDSVNDETIVCIVEAMKLFNEIEAEITGEIVEILVGNGELVEYGQPLFRVKTK